MFKTQVENINDREGNWVTEKEEVRFLSEKYNVDYPQYFVSTEVYEYGQIYGIKNGMVFEVN